MSDPFTAYELDGGAAIQKIRELSEENAALHHRLVEMYERIIPEEIAKGVATRLASTDRVRAPLGIASDADSNVTVACDDGTVWTLGVVGWKEIPPIPGTQAARIAEEKVAGDRPYEGLA